MIRSNGQTPLPSYLTWRPHVTQTDPPFSLKWFLLLFRVTPPVRSYCANCSVSSDDPFFSKFYILRFPALGFLLSILPSGGPHPGLGSNYHLYAPWLSNPAIQILSFGVPTRTSSRLPDNSTLTASGHLWPHELTTELLISPPRSAPHLLFSILVNSNQLFRPKTWELIMILLFLSYHHPSMYQWALLWSSPKTMLNLILVSPLHHPVSHLFLLHQDFPVSILVHIQSASQKQPGDGTDSVITPSASNSRIAVNSLPEFFPLNLEVAPCAPAQGPALWWGSSECRCPRSKLQDPPHPIPQYYILHSAHFKIFVFLCFYVYSMYASHYLRKGSFVCLVYVCVLRAWNDAVLDRKGLIMPQ